MISGEESRQLIRDAIGPQSVTPEKPYIIHVTAGGLTIDNCKLWVVKTNGHSIPKTRLGLKTLWSINASVGKNGQSKAYRRRVDLAITVRDIANGKPLTAEIMKSLSPKAKEEIVKLVCLRAL